MAKSLPDEYVTFFNRFEDIVYISFGTTFAPPEEQMEMIIAMVKLAESRKTLGFVISLQSYADSFEKI